MELRRRWRESAGVLENPLEEERDICVYICVCKGQADKGIKVFMKIFNIERWLNQCWTFWYRFGLDILDIGQFRLGMGLIIRDPGLDQRSEIRFGSALKIGYLGCPDPNPDNKNLDPSKPNPDILIFRSGYPDPIFKIRNIFKFY